MDIATAQQHAAGLRELADWIEEHSGHLKDSDFSMSPRFLLCRLTRDEFIESVPLLEGQYSVIGDKAGYLTLERTFGPVRVELYIDKDKVGDRVERVRTTTEWALAPEVVAAITPEAVA